MREAPRLMLLLCLVAYPGRIHAVSFYDLGSSVDTTSSAANSVNSDGSVVVGVRQINSGSFQAFRWTQAGGMQDLGVLSGRTNSISQAVSGDGAVVVGYSHGSSSLVARAFRWNQSGGIQSIGTFSGGTDVNSSSYATGTSTDGTYVVGSAQDVPNVSFRAFRWSQSGGMQNLGNLSGSPYWYHSHGLGVSSDGSVVVGDVSVTQNGQKHAFRWTQSTGMQDLGSFNVGDESFANGVSADGATVVGYNQANEYVANRYDTRRAFRWTQAGGMQNLGVLEGATTSEARSVNSDGSIVVGTSGGKAFIWSQGTGMIDLGALLANLLPETTYFRFEEVTDISSDGSTLVGNGFASSSRRAFVVTDLGIPLSTSVNNSQYGTISASGFKIIGSIQNVQAVANPGCVFTGWSGDVSGASNPISVVMNSSKTVIANFSQDLADSDTDGLSNYQEIVTYGTNPNQKDTNSDGIEDGQAVALGYNPSFNFSALIGYLQSHPPTGLYTASQMQAMAIGDLVLIKNANGSFTLNYDIEQSTDLQSWLPYQSLNLPLTNLPPDKAFIRIKAKQ